MEEIKQTLKSVFREIEENQGKNNEGEIKQLLEVVLTKEVAKEVKIKGISKGKLCLGCGSSVLLYQVNLKKNEIEKNIFKKKDLKIKEIKLTI